MKTGNGCNNVSLISLQDKPSCRLCLQCLYTMFVYCNFLVLLSTTACSQNIKKQIVNKEDQNPTDYSFFGRYHYTKSKNYLKRQY